MTNAKKKQVSPGGPPPEFRERLDRAVSALVERLPADVPLEVFHSCVEGLCGHEAEVVEALGRVRSSDVLDFLYQLQPNLTDKVSAKALRKAVYRLEQAGLADAAGPRPRGASMLKPSSERSVRGYLGPFDASGSRMGLLAVPSRLSGYDTGVFLLNQAEGLRDFHALRLTSGELNRMVRDLAGPESDGLIDVPPEQVRYVLDEAKDRSGRMGRPLPGDSEVFLPIAAGVPVPARPLIYAWVSPDELPDREALEAETSGLLNHRLLEGLLVTEEMAPYLDRLEDSDGSVLILTDRQKAERREALLGRIGEDVFQPGRLHVLIRCLEETALLLWRIDEIHPARLALSAAVDLAQPTGRVGDHPFIREIVGRSYGMWRTRIETGSGA